MTITQVIQGIAALTVLAWLAVRLARTPRDVRLWAIAGLIATWGAAYPFGVAATDGVALAGLDPMTSRLVQHLLLLAGAYALICFFLFSAFDAARARLQASGHALPLATAMVIIMLAAAAIPDTLRQAAAMLPGGNHPEPRGITSIGAFYTTANSYLLVAFTSALVLTLVYAQRAEPRLRRGLRLVALGLAAIVAANSTFVVANIVRWAGGIMPQPLLTAAIVVLLPGVLLFLAGIIYPAMVMRLAAMRLWWRHRRTYHQLEPLWSLLHAQFPEDHLPRLPGRRWIEALRPGGVHTRYYRRVVECRDGLVRLSPYLAHLEHSHGGDDQPLARRIREALHAHATGQVVPAHAIPIAVPDQPGLDADVDQLLTLARQLDAAHPRR
ncbi:hypothetical protein H0B56_17055 [Haloechinothrix sp. YIM 98757]|uniref:DUF6545 domain-containing protein n=1 Tax=Haloechinothrix aidingensis TaxID=2752311 RepID=A0A838ADH9_9PSEU|nr:MAB_1171c family putative transporter [Haloechinothrix aidingensis]MBA0127261.1 hypothetical protein [Haloechinothrix aidingensis]